MKIFNALRARTKILLTVFVITILTSLATIEFYVHCIERRRDTSSMVFHIINSIVLSILIFFVIYYFVLFNQLRMKDKKIKQSMESLSIITRFNGIGYALFNSNTSQFMGYNEKNELVNQLFSWNKLMAMVYPEDQSKFDAIKAQMRLKENDRFGIECRFKPFGCDSFKWFVIDVVAAPSYKEGDFADYMFMFRDNNLWHNTLEEMSKLRDKAELENRLKTSFLENITHEIRTPLNAVVGFSDIICDEDSADIRQKYKKIIHDNNEELLHKIDDIINLSLLESGSSTFNRLTFDISDFLMSITDSIKRCHNGGMQIICQRNIRFNVTLDPLRLNDVVSALLKNAIACTSKSDGHIELHYAARDNGLYVEVVDNGVGVAASDQKRIFDRFVKVNSFSTGSGLGLSISKAIVEQAHGKIGVKSDIGAGATFWFWIPCEIS